MSKHWENVLISPEDTIKKALEIIDNQALRVVLVVDEGRKLLGTVSDGDVRRGLLGGLNLSDPVSGVMNSNPTTVAEGQSRDALIEVMESKNILFLPVVNELGCIVGLETLLGSLQQPKYENPVFIMAGGFGTRLRPLTDNCPKPMLKVGDRPILETVLRRFINFGFHNFYVSTHYMPETITNYFGDGSQFGVKISYVHEETPLGTGGALGLLKSSLSGDLPLIVANGDVLTTVNFERLLDFHIEHRSDATMCVREYEYKVPYGVIENDGNKITAMVEKPIHRFFVNAGIYVVSPSICSSVEENEHVDMPTLLERHIEKNRDVLMFPIHEYWLDIGRLDDFNRAQVDIYNLGLD